MNRTRGIALLHIGLLILGLPLAATAAPKDAPLPRDSASQAPAPDSGMVERLPPLIERIMPFSSCSPGGGILLQGKNFGSSPGRLRIAGYFPNGWIDLEQLEWGATPKDASLGNESWNVGTPDSAPKLVAWNALPKTLPTSGHFGAGDYAVRARVQGQGDDTWTEWKRFRMAGTVHLQAKPSLGGPETGHATAEALAAAPSTGPEASNLRPKTGLVVPGKPTPEEKSSPSDLTPRRVPGDILGARSNASRTTVSPSREAGSAAPAGPTLALDARGAGPSPSPTTDAPFSVQGLKVRNSGGADAARGHLPLKLDCIPLDGGSCQVNAGGARVPAVPAGETRPLPLEGIFQAGVSGRYRIRVTLEAPSLKPENTWSREVTVTEPARMQQAPRPPTGIRDGVDPFGR